MFRFIKRVFVAATSFFSCNVLECVSMSDQKRKLRPEIINIKSNESSFYPYSVKKKVNIKVVVTISMIYMQNYVFLILLKTSV